MTDCDFCKDLCSAHIAVCRLYDLRSAGRKVKNVALEFGPDIMSSIISIDIQRDIGFPAQFYLYNDWFITLVGSCQKQKIIRNTDDAQALVESAVYSALGIAMEWCRQKGAFDLRERSFRAQEAVYNVHPDYRGLWKKG